MFQAIYTITFKGQNLVINKVPELLVKMGFCN